jgi:tRNA(Ile)-lysidine synthase
MHVMADRPLRADEFDSLLANLAPTPPEGRLALAVSGGPDSMALAFAAKQWSDHNHFPSPQAFIVDHSMRPESGLEAAEVKSRLESLGVNAEILRWIHAPLTSRLHSEARKARYRLLLQACREHNIASLLFAHQREDQAETILMRLAKGSGLDGLAGIPAQSVMEGVRILRPLLTVPKERLIATCRAAGISFVSDPSNKLEKFARGRLRRVMPLLADEGLSIGRLIDFGVRASEARDALEHYTQEFLRTFGHRDDFGVIFIEKVGLLAVPRAVALRALGLALQSVHTEDYAPSHASLSLLLDALKHEGVMPPRTLNGCRIALSKKHVTVTREFAAITAIIPIRAGESVVWDGRWRITLAATEATADIYTIKALGNPPHEVLDRLSPGLRHKVPQGRVRAALPALWRGDELVRIPCLGNAGKMQAKLLTQWLCGAKN